MDINLLFEAGMRSCGRVLKVLPQDEIGSPLIYMQKILKEETIPSLNILLPRLLTKTFPIYALDKVSDGDNAIYGSGGTIMDNRYNAFRVPKNIVDGADIMGVKDCFLAYGDNSKGSTSFQGLGVSQLRGGIFGRSSSADMYAMAYSNALQYADAQLMGTMVPQFRIKFFQPNVLWINKPYADEESTFITVTFKLCNDENLVTVPDTAYEEIKKLFILDLKKTIYSEYAPFSEVETPTGQVNIKIDEWSNAEDNRDQLYESYLSTAHFRNTSMRTG